MKHAHTHNSREERFERWNPIKEPGDKFCTQCKGYHSAEGGMQIVFADKLHQRWVCEKCKIRLGTVLSGQ